MNFQAVVTAIAGVHLINGSPLGWLKDAANDTPIAVWAETGGPGDDIRLELRDRAVVEIQAKRGLQAGDKLWDSLMSLARGVNTNTIAYGVLVVSPDSSRSIAYELSRDIRRLADGRTDDLSEIGAVLSSKFASDGLPVQSVCQRIRIQVVHGLDVDDASITTAKATLGHVCEDRSAINNAWNRLYRDATALIERRGRWDASAILRLFNADGIKVATTSGTPGSLLQRLTYWVNDNNERFSIFGVKTPLSINQWLPLKAAVVDNDIEEETDLARAMAQYHDGDTGRSRSETTFSDAEWVGRFYYRAVVTAGPGLGKSTLLTKIAKLYARDGFPVLKVRLSAVAASMQSGQTFVESVLMWGLDGSGISPQEALSAGFQDWVLLCDGLDECHSHQETVAKGLKQFAVGHPHARIVVTTRPIGYSTAELWGWRHYELWPLGEDKGPEHLVRLIQAAVPTSSILHERAPGISAAEIENSASAKVISRSPQLLGMAASLIIRGGSLGSSKAKLYQNLFDLIDSAPNLRPGAPITSRPVLTRALNAFGWALMVNPLASTQSVVSFCGDVLSPDLGVPALKALEIATEALRHWEDVGLIEQIHCGSAKLLTFTHKTFAEFAAARYLHSLKTDTQRAEIISRIETAAWSEILAFASSLGLADLMLTELLADGRERNAGSINRALSLLIDSEMPVSTEIRKRIVELAFDAAVNNEADDVFAVGLALSDLASVGGDFIGPWTTTHLQASKFSTKLIAWTCAVDAGPAFYELDAVAEAIPTLAAEAGPALGSSLLGGLRVKITKDRDLLQRLALSFVRAALDEWPGDKVTEYVHQHFNVSPFDTYGFYSKLEKLLSAKGLRVDYSKILGGAMNALSQFAPSVNGYDLAVRASLEAMLTALAPPNGVEQSIDLEKNPPLHFSAFLGIIGYGEVIASDVWAWTKPFDLTIVREVLHAVATVSLVDRRSLALEAAAMLQRLHDTPTSTIYQALSPKVLVDVPEPEWSNAKSLKLSVPNLETALNHGSSWFVSAAANLLMGHEDTTEDRIAKLLTSGQNYGLAAAAYLSQALGSETATKLLLDRIEGPVVPGFRYLFITIKDLAPPWSVRIAAAIEKGLMSTSPRLAEEAAALARNYVLAQADVDPNVLNDAFDYWLRKEEPYPQESGVVPDSPRNILLESLLHLGDVDDARLFGLCRDARDDVRKIAKEAVLKRAASSDDVRGQLVFRILAKNLPPALLSQVLTSKIPFSRQEINQLRGLLTDEKPTWRLAATRLLDAFYLEPESIRATAQHLSEDMEPEVRRTAMRILRQTAGFSQ